MLHTQNAVHLIRDLDLTGKRPVAGLSFGWAWPFRKRGPRVVVLSPCISAVVTFRRYIPRPYLPTICRFNFHFFLTWSKLFLFSSIAYRNEPLAESIPHSHRNENGKGSLMHNPLENEAFSRNGTRTLGDLSRRSIRGIEVT